MKILVTLLAASTLAAFSIALLPSPAFAQRGESYIEQEAPPVEPTTPYPGFLDTHLVPRGKLVFELPSGSFDVGVTDNLTVGTNAYSVYFLSTALTPLAVLKARYRFFSNGRVSFVGTGYAGLLYSPSLPAAAGVSGSLLAHVLLGTANAAVYLTPSTALGIHLVAGQLNQSLFLKSVRGDASETLAAVFGGVSISQALGERFSLELALLAPAYFKLSADDPSQRLVVTSGIASGVIPFRVMGNIRAGERHVLSPMLMGYYSIGGKEIAFLPMLSWGVLLR